MALSSCLFETLGQDQFSGGLHYHTGHRPGNSVLQRGWQRRAWCLGVLRPHRSPEAQILQDDKRKTQMYATGRSQGETQPARVSSAGFWAGSHQPYFSHDAHRASSTRHSSGWGTVPPGPRDRQACYLCDTTSRDCWNHCVSWSFKVDWMCRWFVFPANQW